jgi:hypothetical protein
MSLSDIQAMKALKTINNLQKSSYLYPFQASATFKDGTNTDVSTVIKSAIKEVKLYNASLYKKYNLVKLYRGYSIAGTPYWIISIYEVSGDSSVTEVAVFSQPNYTEKALDRVVVKEKVAGGVWAEVVVDWSKIPNGTYYEFYNYSKTGLDITTYRNPSDYTLDIKIPSTIQAVVGKEINVYWDNIIYASDVNYQIDLDCAIGVQQQDRWTCVPTSAGTYSLDIRVYKNFTLVKSVTTSIVVKAASVGNTITRKCLFIGDSTTDQGFFTQGILDNFTSDVMKVTLLGSRGTAPNSHEGRSGWTINQYYTDPTSPFVFSGAFNFAQYMTTKGYTGLERVIIHLGINDVFDYYDDVALNSKITTALSQYQSMVDNIKAYDSTIKIGIGVTIPPSRSQDAFGKNYTTYQTQWRYRRNWWLWSKALIDQFRLKEAQNIYVIPLNVNLDIANNMQTETVQVNARNTATIVRQSNGVHPADIGYYQMSDVVFNWLKGFES